MSGGNKFSHFDQSGKAIMVDVSEKKETSRTAVACGRVKMKMETLKLVEEGRIGKGDVLGVARVAGIMAAKRTWELIPMCHPIMINGCNIEFLIDKIESAVIIEASIKVAGKTGVEMEALTAVSTAALTIYDMCKAVDKEMVIEDVRLISKIGGRSGHWSSCDQKQG
jgi:cyclic pyranopterin monophosphate synthase